MLRNRLALMGICLALVLAGCTVSVVRSERKVVFVHTEGSQSGIVPDEDPVYDEFEVEILGDSTLARFFSLYEQTTDAFLSTNMANALETTLRSRPIIVLDSPKMGVLRNVDVQHEGEMLKIELALGTGEEGQFDLALVRRRFPRLVASWLLALLEFDTFQGDPTTLPRVYEPTTPSLAFELGLGAALDAIYAQERPQVLGELYAQDALSPEDKERLYCYAWVPSNGLRYRFEGDRPTSTLRPREEAVRTPGVVAAFFFQLIQRTGSFYPQRYIIWMVSYDDQTKPYGKLLLALARMPRDEISIDRFIETYVETFPLEEAAVRTLADRTFGARARE